MKKKEAIWLSPRQAKLLKECLIGELDHTARINWGQRAEDDLEEMITQLGGRGQAKEEQS
jgi:hypothetical protein